MTTKVPDRAKPRRVAASKKGSATTTGDTPVKLQADQTTADADQTASDDDQSSSDADQAGATTDQASADKDQEASNRDQATADRDRASGRGTAADERAYQASRTERDTDTYARDRNRLRRADTGRARDATARQRDRSANARDEVGRARDAHVVDRILITPGPKTTLTKQLETLLAQAEADREQAAKDRDRAAKDRARAARERAKLEAELERAHLDDLTGAYRRGMGWLALTHEVDRAHRSGGPFTLAFVDVDRLKAVNDSQGHAVGDQVLQKVVRIIRENLRSFDPVVRYGGDEFICGLSGASPSEARRRFAAITAEIATEAEIDISVGLAALKPADTVERLTHRADVAMLRVKTRHHARDPVPVMEATTGPRPVRATAVASSAEHGARSTHHVAPRPRP
jgi:diguanylate cyclase (GGDEF)-like protein